MTHLLLSSDPVLSSMRNIKIKYKVVEEEIGKYILRKKVDREDKPIEENEISSSLSETWFWEDSSSDDDWL